MRAVQGPAKLARKTFECTQCKRVIRMLVGAEKLSVVCDACRGQAQLVSNGPRASVGDGTTLKRAGRIVSSKRLVFSDKKSSSKAALALENQSTNATTATTGSAVARPASNKNQRPGLPLAKHRSDNTNQQRGSRMLEEEKKAEPGELEWMRRRLNGPTGGTGKPPRKGKELAVEKAAKQLKDRKNRKRAIQEENKAEPSAEQLELFNEIVGSRAEAATIQRAEKRRQTRQNRWQSAHGDEEEKKSVQDVEEDSDEAPQEPLRQDPNVNRHLRSGNSIAQREETEYELIRRGDADRANHNYGELHREFTRLPAGAVRAGRDSALDASEPIIRGESSTAEPPGGRSGLIADLRENIRRRREEYLNLRAEFEEIERQERRERMAREAREQTGGPVSTEEFKTQTDRIRGVLERPAPSFPRPVPRAGHEPHGLEEEDLGTELRVPSIFVDGHVGRRERERQANAEQERQPRFRSQALDPEQAMRTAHRDVTNRDGSVTRVFSIGVPRSHPFADLDNEAGQDSGLYNLRIGPIRLPAAPAFAVRIQAAPGSEQINSSSLQTEQSSRLVQIEPRFEGRFATEADLTLIDQQIGRITGAINTLLQRFTVIFSGYQFLRMQQEFHGVSPNAFMANFNSSFSPDDQLLEMVRRISEREALNSVKNAASKEAVAKLPVVEIEEKHCKGYAEPIQGKIPTRKRQQEPPTCTVCVEPISLGTKGMFMPCGHVFHPGCLEPWFERQNTCPVCRYEIPKATDEDKKGRETN